MHSVHSTSTSCYANPASEITSLEDDATTSSDTSHDATNEEVVAYTRPEDVRDDNHRDATWTLLSFDATDRVDEHARQAPLALTQRTLQQHNAQNIPADGKAKNTYLFDENYMVAVSLVDTAAYPSTLDENSCLKAHVQPTSCSRQGLKHHVSTALATIDGQIFDADIGLLFPPVEHRGLYAYPTCINEVDLYDHLLDSAELGNEFSITKTTFSESSLPEETSFQALGPWRNAYAGIGAQFIDGFQG